MSHHNRGLTPNTTHAWQRTPLPPIHSPVPQSDKSVSHTARPSASITEVLEYIRKKKLDKSTTLPGEEWLKRLYGRDQVPRRAQMASGNLTDWPSTDLPNRRLRIYEATLE
jgi:hypothetical protein